MALLDPRRLPVDGWTRWITSARVVFGCHAGIPPGHALHVHFWLVDPVRPRTCCRHAARRWAAAELPSNRQSLSMDGVGQTVSSGKGGASHRARGEVTAPFNPKLPSELAGCGACMDPSGTLELWLGLRCRTTSCKCCARLLKQRTPACAVASGWGALLSSRAPIGSKKDHAGTFSPFPVVSGHLSCQVAMRPRG